jgi:hypothetical protein
MRLFQFSTHHSRLITRYALLIALFLLSGCGATFEQLLPTDRPTPTTTYTPSPTRTPGRGEPTITPTFAPVTPTGGPSPTPLLGATSTSVGAVLAPTVVNPNAPQIEYFTSDSALGVAPGSTLTLFWSTRGTDTVVIYRLDRSGERTQLWNVPPDGSLPVATRSSERGTLEFVLSAGEGSLISETQLTIPLACPDPWFFSPAPDDCPIAPASPSGLSEQPFERGRMLYIAPSNTVYALFNDGFDPAWVAFDNRYDPTVHPESLENFVPPPGFYQPIAVLGFVWRGNDTVRNRLGLAIQPQSDYEGFIQNSFASGTSENLYVSSIDGSVLLLIPGGESWQILAPSAP